MHPHSSLRCNTSVVGANKNIPCCCDDVYRRALGIIILSIKHFSLHLPLTGSPSRSDEVAPSELIVTWKGFLFLHQLAIIIFFLVDKSSHNRFIQRYQVVKSLRIYLIFELSLKTTSRPFKRSMRNLCEAYRA